MRTSIVARKELGRGDRGGRVGRRVFPMVLDVVGNSEDDLGLEARAWPLHKKVLFLIERTSNATPKLANPRRAIAILGRRLPIFGNHTAQPHRPKPLRARNLGDSISKTKTKHSSKTQLSDNRKQKKALPGIEPGSWEHSSESQVITTTL